MQLLGDPEVTAVLWCYVSVLGRLRDLQYICAVTSGSPSSWCSVILTHQFLHEQAFSLCCSAFLFTVFLSCSLFFFLAHLFFLFCWPSFYLGHSLYFLFTLFLTFTISFCLARSFYFLFSFFPARSISFLLTFFLSCSLSSFLDHFLLLLLTFFLSCSLSFFIAHCLYFLLAIFFSPFFLVNFPSFLLSLFLSCSLSFLSLFQLDFSTLSVQSGLLNYAGMSSITTISFLSP